MEAKGVLLESGTNELEIVEFNVANNKFGINVIKVREIINPIPVVTIPHSHKNIEGIIEIRGEILPVVNMAKVLGYPESEQPALDKYIVTEFNKQKIVFHVHGVDKIHRISWGDIEKPTNLYQSLESQIIGVVRKENDMILLLDFEKIVVDINPATGINNDRLKHVEKRDRSNFKIVVAEDSALLRKLLSDTLTEAGFQKVDFFENGKDALDYLEYSIKEEAELEKIVDLIITDIEMPIMDGLFLTKQVKEHPVLSKLPVVIFSSLITEDLRHKGQNVGANAQVSKPEIGELINIIDRLLNK
ncbi:chemotaxis protein [Neobacillus sp. PS3-40]|uniref:chemotaxis protein n=1 Tax=Neobacillus sp. PS3-40 TaxID=3070679 RepID=UPI0027DEB50A|nr:chemotaxis protein [Neobacillus sp. PS3-40]WML45800.1 chemotaxis protein [Neobacillus sp. PS3-40]